RKTIAPTTAVVGDTVVMTVTAANHGPNQASGVIVTDVLPAGFTFVSAAPSQGAYSSTDGQWTGGTLTNGQSETLTLTAQVAQAGGKHEKAPRKGARRDHPPPPKATARGGTDDGSGGADRGGGGGRGDPEGRRQRRAGGGPAGHVHGDGEQPGAERRHRRGGGGSAAGGPDSRLRDPVAGDLRRAERDVDGWHHR